LVALGTFAGTAHAQQRPATRLETRLDVFAGGVDAAHLGGGLALPLGTYARLAVLGGVGVARVDDGTGDEIGFSARVDLLGRFHIDPVRQSRWGPYVAAGVSVRSEPKQCCDGFLALLFGLEGPDRDGHSWAFELGFGGGVRAAVVLRGGGARWR
jgi:hypothetical protein